MAGAFSGIEIASRAMQTSQGLINVVGQNIANVNTPGYSRQVAVVRATDPDTMPGPNSTDPAQWGTGVELTSINRVHDALLQARINSAASEGSRYSEMEQTLSSVQAVYAEPGSTGLSSMLTAFFNSFSALASKPEDTASRQAVIQQATNLTAQFRKVASGLDGLRADAVARIAAGAGQANELADQIANLNGQIRTIVASGQQPNDLMDRRDTLVKELSGLVGATATEEQTPEGKPTGVVNVAIGGRSLVQGAEARALDTQFTIVDGVGQLGAGANAVQLTGGTVGGIAQSIGRIDAYRANLDTVASTLISQVNTLHRAGSGLDGANNRDLFTGTSAATIGVSSLIAGNPSALAAAGAPAAGQTAAAGNGDTARAIAGLASKAVIGTDTITGRYNADIATIGADVQSATSAATDSRTVAQQLDSLRSSSEGVSLDEEMTRMLQYQRTYQAAARILTTMDSLLDTLINATAR